ncbi:2OG-Fe(II) oxygenase [Methylosinus sp. LW4]|uniref:2OG-Fe(II) oxygenase n=1 Tax=Methylosinus sp. LW4 TaxID=136993 RepID=UPI0012FA668C|nr:2OG-Fe(II) oxygenase [Methylosinus sp. LW4]
MTAAATPAHVVIDGFLGAARAGELMQFALAHESEFSQSRFYTAERAARIDTSVRDSSRLLELGPLRAAFAASVDLVLAHLTRELNARLPSETKKEIEMVRYGDGGFFKRHADAPPRPDGHDSVRVLTLVYYFHALPQRFEGGALRLFSTDGFADIAPAYDRLVAFPSAASHEVRPTHCATAHFSEGRFSINCWLRRAREIADDCSDHLEPFLPLGDHFSD